MELINLELKFATKKINPQINLPLNFLIQKHFFHNNATWNINYLGYLQLATLILTHRNHQDTYSESQ